MLFFLSTIKKENKQNNEYFYFWLFFFLQHKFVGAIKLTKLEKKLAIKDDRSILTNIVEISEKRRKFFHKKITVTNCHYTKRYILTIFQK